MTDATAVAKYFRLKSETLGLDYSDYENIKVAVPADVVRPDTVPPESCTMSLDSVDYETGEVKVSVEASDADTMIHYVDFSLDGGATWQDLQAFDGTKQTFTLQARMGSTPTIVARAYDLYDLKTESNTITIFIPLQEEETEEITSETETLSRIPLDLSMSASEIRAEKGSLILLILCVSLILTGSLYFVIRLLQKRKRRNKGHKEW